jgi:hypothetical protein
MITAAVIRNSEKKRCFTTANLPSLEGNVVFSFRMILISRSNRDIGRLGG